MAIRLHPHPYIQDKVYNWSYTCYPGAKEELPPDMPIPLGLRITLSSFVDAKLYHDMSDQWQVRHGDSSLLQQDSHRLVHQTPTFGSEYIAARTCTEQTIALRTTLRYLGVPVEGPSYMFGDNETVINTASEPHGKLHKRHNALSFRN